MEFYTSVIENEPNNSSAYNWRGMIRRELGDLDHAIADYDEALRIEPSHSFAFNNRGSLRLSQKDYDRAIADFDAAIRNNPGHALAHNNRGMARQAKKMYEEALADYDRAAEISPQYAVPLNESAWLRATCPVDVVRNGDKAIIAATKACELTAWKEAGFLDTLAAAHAETGSFEQAIRWQKKAIKAAPPDSTARREFVARLALYEKKLPYRLPMTSTE